MGGQEIGLVDEGAAAGAVAALRRLFMLPEVK